MMKLIISGTLVATYFIFALCNHEEEIQKLSIPSTIGFLANSAKPTRKPMLKPSILSSSSPIMNTKTPSSKPSLKSTSYPTKPYRSRSTTASPTAETSLKPTFRSTGIPSKKSNKPTSSSKPISNSKPSIIPSSSMPTAGSNDFMVYQLNNYNPYIYGGPRVIVYEGSRIAIVVSDGVQKDFNPNITDKRSNAAMRTVLLNIQRILSVYDTMVGRIPPPAVSNPQIHGKVPYEIGYINAGGLAAHGVAGVATGPAFINDMYQRALQGESNINHVYFYETMRNYIFPEVFTLVLDYSLSGGSSDWGWVNQGFIDVTGCLVSETISPPVTFNYYGNDREAFMNSMEAKLVTYVSNSAYNWANTFMQNRLPWSPSESVDNLFAGILVNLYRYEGGFSFMSGFFHALSGLVPRAPKSKLDNQAARDNFYLAASIGAQRNLLSFFASDLRWTISAGAASYLSINFPGIADIPGHRVTRAPSPRPSTRPPTRSDPRIFLTARAYSMNLGGIAGADAICSAEAGGPAQALLTDEMGCSGVPCRRAASPQIDWPLRPRTAYYTADFSSVLATTDSSGLLPAQLQSAVIVSGCINQATGMGSDWSTSAGFTCSDWTSTAYSGRVAVGWLCPQSLSTSDLLSGGSFDCGNTLQFLCVTSIAKPPTAAPAEVTSTSGSSSSPTSSNAVLTVSACGTNAFICPSGSPDPHQPAIPNVVVASGGQCCCFWGYSPFINAGCTNQKP